MHGNPGLTIEDTSTLRESCFSSPSRLDLMPKGVSMLLKRWMSLQSAENGNIEQSVNNSNKQDGKISSNINALNIEKKILNHDVKSVISREQNSIKPPVNIDSEYQDFKNGFESHETLKKILEEESHLDVDQSWLDEDEEVEKEEVENWKEMKAREVGFKEEIENDLYMGSEDDDDSEALSIDVVAGRQVNRYMMAAADPRNIDQRNNYQIQDIDEYRPPSRQSLKPRSQSLITAFASGSGLSSVVKDTVQHPESVYQSYVTDVEHWIGSPGHGHGHDLVQRPTWLSTNRNETLLDSRPSSAPGTRRGITGVTAGAFMSRSNVNRLEQFNSLEAFGCKNISPNSIAAKSRLLKLQQESSAMPLRRHSVDGIHFTQKLRSRSNCKNSSFSVRRQEEMSRRLTTGESTARPGHLLSAMRNKPMTLRQRSHSIFPGVGTSIGKDKNGQTSMRMPYGNWCVSHSSDGAFARNSPKGFHINELDGGGEMDIRNRHKQQHNFFKEEVISSNRKSRIKSYNQGKWKGNKITASEDEKRIKTNGFTQDHNSLDSILGQFKESVTSINKSLDDVSAQLKNVSSSLNESVLERTPGSFRSQSNSEMQSIVSCPSSAQVKKSERSNVRTSLSHSATTAFIDDDSIDISATLGSPQHHASHMISDFTNNRVTIKVPNPNTPSTTVPVNDTSSSLDVLGQTLGRTRGSLIRRTNNEDTIHDHYYEIENNSEKRKTWRSPVTHRDPRSLGHDRDGREIGRDSSSPSHHKIVTGSGLGSDVGVDRSMVLRDDENDNYFEDRHGSNNMKSPSCSSSSSPDSHFTRSQRSKEGKKIIDIENDSERGINKERGGGKESGGGSESESDKIITQSGISLLIRDRLRSKLESILRPNLK